MLRAMDAYPAEKLMKMGKKAMTLARATFELIPAPRAMTMKGARTMSGMTWLDTMAGIRNEMSAGL